MIDVLNEKVVFSPSLICLDLCNLENQIRLLEASDVKALHVDIIDGHFSPSMPLGLDTVKQLRQKTNLFFDCHVMVSKLDFFVEELIQIGVQQIVFHAETCEHIDGMLNKIHAAGIKAGVALKPSTPLSVLDYVLEKCDTVLLMLINPGYASSAGESQVSYAERKIHELRSMIDEAGLHTKIEIDGRVSPTNIEKYANEVNLFVCGSTCFKKDTIKESFDSLNKLRKKILK